MARPDLTVALQSFDVLEQSLRPDVHELDNLYGIDTSFFPSIGPWTRC